MRGLLGAVPARAVAPPLRGPWSAALWLPRLGSRWPEPSSPGGGSPASERLPGRWGRQPGPRRGGGDRGGSARPLLGRSPGSRGRGVAAPAASDAAAAAAAAEAATAAGGRGEAAAQCGTGPGVGRAMRGGCPTAAPGRHLASSSPQSLVAAAAVVHGAREPLGQLDAAESAPRWVHSGAPTPAGVLIPLGPEPWSQAEPRPCCGPQIFCGIRTRGPRSLTLSSGQSASGQLGHVKLKPPRPLSAPPDAGEGGLRSALVSVSLFPVLLFLRNLGSQCGFSTRRAVFCPRGRKPDRRAKPANKNRAFVLFKGPRRKSCKLTRETLPLVFLECYFNIDSWF